jgi:hypothetical protein
LGILLNPKNREIPFPLVFTGPRSAMSYFDQIDHFIQATLGTDASRHYRIIIDDAPKVAKAIRKGIGRVRTFRLKTDDAFYFNWRLKIQPDFQTPFLPTHENMTALRISQQLPPHLLAVNLRRAFSGIVTGNVKDYGIRAVEKHGLYQINGDKYLMTLMDKLLSCFIEQQRMKLPGDEYMPCYQVVKN